MTLPAADAVTRENRVPSGVGDKEMVKLGPRHLGNCRSSLFAYGPIAHVEVDPRVGDVGRVLELERGESEGASVGRGEPLGRERLALGRARVALDGALVEALVELPYSAHLARVRLGGDALARVPKFAVASVVLVLVLVLV